MPAHRTYITIQMSFDGIHNWPAAPNFLRHPHQHLFQIRLRVETIPGDNTRALEFFDVKKELEEAIDHAFPEIDSLGIRDLGDLSTEAISDRIHEALPKLLRCRHSWIEVKEDDTQGSESEYLPISTATSDGGVVLSQEQLQEAIKGLGRQISWDYREAPTLTVVCLLKGAFIFAADLIREIDHPGLEVDFLRLKSYTGKKRGKLKTVGPIPPVKGKHVLLLDDICDSGETLKSAMGLLKRAGAASIRLAVLLRRGNNTVPLTIDYCGAVLEGEEFVSGYGLDVDERERGLPFLRKAC